MTAMCKGEALSHCLFKIFTAIDFEDNSKETSCKSPALVATWRGVLPLSEGIFTVAAIFGYQTKETSSDCSFVHIIKNIL